MVEESSMVPIDEFCEEIAQGIVNLSGLSKFEVNKEVVILRKKALNDKNPELSLKLALFRKYSDLANEIKDSSNLSSIDKYGIISELPQLSYQTDEEALVGFTATRTHIFWARFSVLLFAFISFVTMCFVPNINYTNYHPSYSFTPYCPYSPHRINGSFSFIPYHFVITIGVINHFYCMILALYYLLPVNEERKKYIPGLKQLLRICRISDPQIEEINERVSNYIQYMSKFLLMIVDGILLLISLLIAIIVSIKLERPSEFIVTYSKFPQYFTLESFFKTYQATSPICLTGDIVPSIRASLAMLYLSAFGLFICFQFSYVSYRQEVTKKTLTSGYGVASNEEIDSEISLSPINITKVQNCDEKIEEDLEETV